MAYLIERKGDYVIEKWGDEYCVIRTSTAELVSKHALIAEATEALEAALTEPTEPALPTQEGA